MLRCTGLDNLVLGLVCQVGVRLEKGVRRMTGTTLPDVPFQAKVFAIKPVRRPRRLSKDG